MPKQAQIADEHLAEDLQMTIDNEYSLYNQKNSIEKNLTRKYKKGIYSEALTPKLWLYLVDNGAKIYFQRTGIKVDKATRLLTAALYASEYKAELDAGNFHE